ncbi:MAG: trimethylamine methyltransferase family protein, partial [Candidatus Kariarchaeaceae archaeon]
MGSINKKLEFLSIDEIKEIHNTSLQILEEIGCHIPHLKILEILENSGARVNFNSQIVFFPRELVEKIIHEVPKSFEVVPAYFENT